MNVTRAALLACSLALATTSAFSQMPGPNGLGQDSPRGMDRHGEGRGMGREGHGMGIFPMGAWWKNPDMVSKLSLTPDQQKRMDDILLQSRLQLIQMKATLEEEQVKLEPLLNTNPLDQGKTLAQISKIADLRADLEKANAKMLLGLRAVLTPDQWTKLQSDRHSHREGFHGREGMNGPGGPQGGGNMHPPSGPNDGPAL